MDDFTRGPYLFNLRQNASLRTVRVKGAPGHALEARPATPGEPFLFGRRFPLDETWSCHGGLSFWYQGHRSGQKIEVELLGKEAPDPGPAGWKLVWSDEFNGPAGAPPDPSIWAHDTGGTGWGNNELEYYTNSTQNAALDGQGNLAITARQATGKLDCWYGPCRYTSARLLTKDRVEFTHGRIEARIRIPRGAGIWPAFWALGTNIDRVGWPQCGEIDIMENVGRQPRRVYGTIHGPGYSGASGISGTYDAPQDLADTYHTYAVEWQPDRITWYLDGIAYHTAAPHDAAPNQWVFNHPFFLLLNVAVGGDFGGPVGADTTFPQPMLVDYVRVYQAPDTAERFASSFRDSFSGWRKVTLPFSSFRRSAAQPAGAPQGQKLTTGSIWGYAFHVPGVLRAPVRVARVRLAR